MKYNTMTKIDSAEGEFIVLVDYGLEGISVVSQHMNIESALLAVPSANLSSVAIVKLIDITVTA